MSGNYAQDWKPRNLGGRIYYDPRDELAYWANRAGNDPMVAVPVATLRAASVLRECSARLIVRADEDGPLSHPVETTCRKASGHEGNHSNGYSSWLRREGLPPEDATYLLEVRDESQPDASAEKQTNADAMAVSAQQRPGGAT